MSSDLLASFSGSQFHLERVLSEIPNEEQIASNPEVAAAYSWALRNGLIREYKNYATTDAGVQLLEYLYINNT